MAVSRRARKNKVRSREQWSRKRRLSLCGSWAQPDLPSGASARQSMLCSMPRLHWDKKSGTEMIEVHSGSDYKLFACGFRHRTVRYDTGDGSVPSKHQLLSYSHLCEHVFTPKGYLDRSLRAPKMRHRGFINAVKWVFEHCETNQGPYSDGTVA